MAFKKHGVKSHSKRKFARKSTRGKPRRHVTARRTLPSTAPGALIKTQRDSVIPMLVTNVNRQYTNSQMWMGAGDFTALRDQAISSLTSSVFSTANPQAIVGTNLDQLKFYWGGAYVTANFVNSCNVPLKLTVRHCTAKKDIPGGGNPLKLAAISGNYSPVSLGDIRMNMTWDSSPTSAYHRGLQYLSAAPITSLGATQVGVTPQQSFVYTHFFKEESCKTKYLNPGESYTWKGYVCKPRWLGTQDLTDHTELGKAGLTSWLMYSAQGTVGALALNTGSDPAPAGTAVACGERACAVIGRFSTRSYVRTVVPMRRPMSYFQAQTDVPSTSYLSLAYDAATMAWNVMKIGQALNILDLPRDGFDNPSDDQPDDILKQEEAVEGDGIGQWQGVADMESA